MLDMNRKCLPGFSNLTTSEEGQSHYHISCSCLRGIPGSPATISPLTIQGTKIGSALWTTKGTFHAKMGSIKDRNGMDLTEAEDIKKRWQEYTEELYKKDLHDPDNHDGVITDLEPDILECEVKWASGSITTNKASGSDGIPVELFQILKDDAVKVLHSISHQIRKTQQWPQDWKRSVFIPIPKKSNVKECQTTAQLHSSHTLAK